MPGVCAIVVTHNRRALLARGLAALSAQTRQPDRILVVDNASTDGTAEMVDRDHPEVERVTLPENGGGAAGFHFGITRAHATGAEWLWLMDDDTIAEPPALSELLKAAEMVTPTPLLLASLVLWRDGTPHPMNFPTLERRRMDLVVASVEHRILPVRTATFVSLLVHRDAITRFGLPRQEFFVWTEDIEFTSRVILGGGGAYLVPRSVVVHETAQPADFTTAPPERFYYHVRNTILTARRPERPPRDRVLRVFVLVTTCLQYLRRERSSAAVAWVLRGLRDGVRGRGGPAPGN